MRQRNFRRSLLDLLAIAGLIFLLSLVGCPDDDGGDDDLEVTDLSGRTFNNLALGVIDENLEEQTGTLEFGPAVNEIVPFELSIGANSIVGTATVSTIEFSISEINEDDTGGAAVTIPGDPDDVTFTVGDTFQVDAEISTDGDEQTITFSNPDTSFSQDFIFDNPNDTDSTGNTGD
jgi:uncharacterized protein YaiE (UPF0345 family)